jgi:RNA polymerase sigma-70 factor (ECF subfamily)
MSAQLDPLHAERGRLFGLAYRMLGSAGEAEDAVQEAYARWYAQPRDDVENPPGFLTTVVTRVCLDELKSARRQRETYPGVWLPEPVADDGEGPWPEAAGSEQDPEQSLQRLESVSLAFLALLETLSPLERAVYVLSDVFDYSHAEIGAMLERTPEACRQALRRAREQLAAGRRPRASAERHRELLGSFLRACRNGDIDELTRLLADDVVSRADGGGYVTAATKPVNGVRAVSRLFAGLAQFWPAGVTSRIETVNGWPAALVCVNGALVSVVQIRTSGDRVETIDQVMNPRKLARIGATFGLQPMMRP